MSIAVMMGFYLKYGELLKKRLYLMLGLAVLLLLIWLGTSTVLTTSAQDDAPATPTVLPACEPFFVTSPQGLEVRACASYQCGVVTVIPSNTSVCVQGQADNPSWVQVNLDINDSASPIYYAPRESLGVGSSDASPALNTCQPFLVNVASVNLHACASDSCNVVGQLPAETWVCAQQYDTGEYAGWGYVELSDPDLTGWTRLSGLRPTSSYGSRIGPTPTPQLTPNNSTSSGSSSIEPLPDPPVIEGARPVCEYYYVNVSRGNVRQCASTNCPLVETLEAGTVVCIRGQAPQTGWLISDLEPTNPNSALTAISADILVLGTSPEGPNDSNCFDWYEVTASTRVAMRVCAGLTCPAVDTLEPGTLVCAREYGGPYTEWVRVEVPGEAGDGWVFGTMLSPIGDSAAIEPSLTQQTTPVFASTPAPGGTPSASITVAGSVMSEDLQLANLGIRDITLDRYYNGDDFRFWTPNNWSFEDDNFLRLSIKYSEFLPEAATLENGSTLNVYLDGILIGSIPLSASTVGERVVSIPIPAPLLETENNESHRINYEFDAREYCRVNGYARVTISSELSGFQFQYRQASPDLNLANYPAAFKHRFSVAEDRSESVTIVLPDNPSAETIQAGLNVAAGLGSLTGNSLLIDVITASELVDQNQNLILVGLIDRHSVIASLYAQNLLLTDFNTRGQIIADPSVGVVELIPNPANSQYAVLVVTGLTSDALLRAADAIAGLPVNATGSTIVAKDFRPEIDPDEVNEFTFAELGYDDTILINGIGENDYFISFWLAPNVRLDEGAYVDLSYSVSEIVTQSSSSLNLWMNDNVPLASIALNGSRVSPAIQPITQQHLRAPIPPNSVVPGIPNDLILKLNVDDDWGCDYPDPAITWLSVNNDSKIVLPNAPLSFSADDLSISSFPQPLNSARDLSDVLVSLPTFPSIEDIQTAYRLVAAIADQVNQGGGFSPVLALGGLPPNTDLSKYHLIMIGRPTTNPILATINDYSPSLFTSGTDEFVAPLGLNTFANPNQVGVVSIVPSLWSDNHAILIVSGNSPSGQNNASRLLVSQEIKLDTINGSTVFFDGQTVRTISENQ